MISSSFPTVLTKSPNKTVRTKRSLVKGMNEKWHDQLELMRTEGDNHA